MKTALTAENARKPPPGVDDAEFIDPRLMGGNDSSMKTDALISDPAL